MLCLGLLGLSSLASNSPSIIWLKLSYWNSVLVEYERSSHLIECSFEGREAETKNCHKNAKKFFKVGEEEQVFGETLLFYTINIYWNITYTTNLNLTKTYLESSQIKTVSCLELKSHIIYLAWESSPPLSRKRQLTVALMKCDMNYGLEILSSY